VDLGFTRLSIQSQLRWVAAILAIFGLLSVIYNIAIPLFEAPDELWHFSFVRILAEERALPVQPSEGKDMWLREAGQPPLYYILAAPFVIPLDTDDFPDFVRFNVAHPAITAHSDSDAPNVFIHTPHEAFPYKDSVLAVHIVRLVSLAWGLLTILGVYLVAREIVPDQPLLQLTAVAVAAFNPHFIYISSVVNNDAAAACLCTLTLWLTVRLVGLGRETFGQRLPASIWPLGIILGAALLSKVSALPLLGLVGGALGLLWLRDRRWGALFMRAGIVFGEAALVGAWWYARNWLLYGDPLAWDVWLIDIGVHRIGVGELLGQFGTVARTFWSPYVDLFPASVFWLLGGFLALAAVGWVRLAKRIATGTPRWERGTPIHSQPTFNLEGLLVAGTWLVILFASLVYYMLTTPAAAGRLLFPGIAAFAVLWVLGITAALPPRGRHWAMASLIGSLLALAVLTPLAGIIPRFAPPLVQREVVLTDTVPAGVGVPLESTWAEGADPGDQPPFGSVRLLGAEVEPDIAQEGDTVKAVLYWEVVSSPPEDLRTAVRLWTLGHRLVGQRDTIPAGEVYPPDLWRAGDIIRDVYRIPIEATGPAMCQVSVKVMRGAPGAPNETVLGQAHSPAALRLKGSLVPPVPSTDAMPYTLDNKVALIGYEVADAACHPEAASLVAEGSTLTVTLYWQALAEMTEDYTIFVHLLGPDDTMYSQGDGPPLGNDYPTSHWLPGEVLRDPHPVIIKTVPPDDAHLSVGLYRLSDLTRLPAYDAAGARLPNDAIVLPLRP
jgi:4-amino-4-deoxy-L-arabinose transferase-like glycosyltransferase